MLGQKLLRIHSFLFFCQFGVSDADPGFLVLRRCFNSGV